MSVQELLVIMIVILVIIAVVLGVIAAGVFIGVRLAKGRRPPQAGPHP
jgi:hypothetical protein